MAFDKRRQEFCKYYVQGHTAEESARLAGYSPKYARHNAYSFTKEPEVQAEIQRLRGIAQKVADKKFEYTIEQSFKKLLEIQDLAMEANQKDGEYYNLGTAAKVEELKAKLCGLFEIDNKQKSLPISINFINNYE
mgnify:CR=1 FL=1